MASISLSKWIVMGTLAILSALIGALPYFLLKKVKSLQQAHNFVVYHLTLTILATTGAGVLLATTFVHMLPENRAKLLANPVVHENVDSHIPLAEILTLGGFLFIYLLEEVATLIVEVTGQGGHGHSHGHSHGHGHTNHEPDLQKRRSSVLSIHASSRSSIQFPRGMSPPLPSNNSSTNSKAELQQNLDLEEEPINSANKTSQLGSLIALAALSFHAVMEGIAIGLQDSSLWLMFGAIASHKFLISFCMGMELCAAKAKPKIYIGSIFLFAILSPIGILIGSVVTANSTKSLEVCVLEAFATGTLLYVVFFEILSRERERRHTVLVSRRMTGFLQFAGFLIGLTAMTCLLTLMDHGHPPSDSEHGHEH